ncbi:hypothetical protein [uncultured Xylophilus sp.]|uniref:hypothetical protein n=1 Tax=uncultured Xylophilus sp. TaxID=296832 RepID=UPI0025E1F1E7|nr:hypothetical protein [uncultured Xylophilus sp.]
MAAVRLSSAVCMLALCACSGASADVCFTVLDRANRTIYQSRTAPVDLTRQIGDTLYRRFPTASVMVFGQNNDNCPELRGIPGPGGFAGVQGTPRSPAGGAGPDMTQYFNDRRYAPRS